MKIGNAERDVIVTQFPAYRNWLNLRGFIKDGKPDFSANYKYFEMLNDVIRKEPVGAIGPEQRRYIAAIGIEKGQAERHQPE